METGEMTGACLCCLKTFILSTATSSSSCRSELVIPYEARIISPTSRLGFVAPGYNSSPASCPEASAAVGDVGCYDIYTRFLHLSSRYMKLATTTDVFIRAAQHRKNETGEHVQAFCVSCRELISYICDLYAELQAVKLRLIWKLDKVEEIMKNGRNRVSSKLFKGLLNMLMCQLNVRTRIRVEMFRKMFQLKCKSKGTNSAPNALVPRGLFPENWKVGYPACKLVMMRLIVVFLLASSLVVKGKPAPNIVEHLTDKKGTISPGKARRRRGRPKNLSNKDNDNTINTSSKRQVLTESNVKSEVVDDDAAAVKYECADDDNLVDTLGNDSDWCQEAASPDDEDDDVEYNPKHDFTATTTKELQEEIPTQKRWNLRQRTVTATVNFAEDSDSASENDDKDGDPGSDSDAVFEKKTLVVDAEKTIVIKPKSGRGWSRADVPTLPCPKCQKLFLDKRCLSSHLRHIHNSGLTHSCVTCGEKFVRWKELRNHKRAVHRKMKCKKGWSKKPRPCPLCPQQFSTLAALAAHRQESHGAVVRGPRPIPRKCPVCEVTFPNIKIMKEHSLNVHGDRRRQGGGNRKRREARVGPPSSEVRKCKSCGEEYSSDDKLRKHRRQTLCCGNVGRLPLGRAKCAKCGQIFPTGKQLLEHRRKEHPAPRSHALYQRAYRKRKRDSARPATGETKCTRCEEVFSTRKLMLEHRRKEHVRRWSRHECSTCYRTIIGKKRFEEHLQAHEDNTLRKHDVFYCEVCGKYCYKLESLQSHMTSFHKDKYSCSVCQAEFDSGKLLRDHLVTHEESEKYFHCMTCFRGFSCRQYFEIHRIICQKDPTNLLCDHDLCNETFATVELLNNHLTTHVAEGPKQNGNEVYTCKFCSQSFIKKYNFTMHELTHCQRNVERSSYDCPVEDCHKRVNHLKRLLTHYNKVHGLNIMPCKCYLCGKTFSSMLYYQLHMDKCEDGKDDPKTQEKSLLASAASVLYSYKRKRSCRMCGKQFPNKLAFLEHKATHHPPPLSSKRSAEKKNIERIKCPEENCDEMRTPHQMKLHLLRKHGKGDRYPCEKCGRAFVDVRSVNDHMQVHEPARFKCDICDKAFKKACRLSYHKLSVHAESRQKDFTCHLCGMSYYSQTGLRFHVYSKHSQAGELPYMCEWCGKGYGRKTLFTLHIKNCAKQHQQMEPPKGKPLKRRGKGTKKRDEEEEEMSDKSTTEDEIEEDETVEVEKTVMPIPVPSSSEAAAAAAIVQYNLPNQNIVTTGSSIMPLSLQPEHIHHGNPQMFSNFPYYSHDNHLPVGLPPPCTPTTLPSADINSR